MFLEVAAAAKLAQRGTFELLGKQTSVNKADGTNGPESYFYNDTTLPKDPPPHGFLSHTSLWARIIIWEDGQTVARSCFFFFFFLSRRAPCDSAAPCFHLGASGSTLGTAALTSYPPSACQTGDSWSMGRFLVKSLRLQLRP